MLHAGGAKPVMGRIENIELTDVGQAFKLGRYPVHFHLSGNVYGSYVRNNAIHQTYNRAVTIHAVHHLAVQNNVVYNSMGHSIFMEDAVETNNVIEGNLVVDTRRSWSLLNTDQTPASFWITHPDNIVRNNRAAGSDRYGYWYDLQVHPTGPSADPNVCPENAKLGEFSDNVAHSNGRYGLRIFHNFLPRTRPCEPMVYDASDPGNPYPANPPVTAQFRNLLSYKNGRNGAIAERVGAVQFHDFKTADNKLAGMEVSLTEDIIDGYAKIVGGLVVGRSANADPDLDGLAVGPHGIITPRTENFRIDGTHFSSFDHWSDGAALGTCSHCFHAAATDSGARTVTVEGLSFDSSVPQRIRYQYPYRAIFHDQDGSLTGQGKKSWATPYWPHNDQPECKVSTAEHDGIVCPRSVQVRRVAFWGYAPGSF